MAAVELINIMRPTVAVARFIAFEAHALYHYPKSRRLIEAGTDAETELFVQEVRRFYPFFPFTGGRVREPFTWQGHDFTPGTWVMLDVYGTDRDPRLWENPDAFQPERFRRWNGSAFNFIPQGAGDHFTTHRCAGEWITIALLKQATMSLVNGMAYTVPEQDLDISLRIMPALPQSGFIMRDIRPASLKQEQTHNACRQSSAVPGSRQGRSSAPPPLSTFLSIGVPCCTTPALPAPNPRCRRPGRCLQDARPAVVVPAPGGNY